MKILLIHNFYRYRGGEDRYVEILERVLTAGGHRVVHFFCDSRDIEGFGFFRKCMIPLRLVRSPGSARRLARLVEREKPQLAVVHNLFPLLSLGVLKVLKRRGVPILKRLENYKFLCLNGLFLRSDYRVCEACKGGNFLPGVFHRCYQRGFFSSLAMAVPEYIHRRLKTLTATADLFLATSDFVKDRFTGAGFPADRILVQPNFIDFAPVSAVTEPQNYAVYVGRLSGEKGVMTLLNAFQGLGDLQLKILGEGPMAGELKSFVRDRGMDNVSFEGFVDGAAKAAILKRARCLIFPSECYESFGYSIIESYACGVPVIASDIGGARELVREGETGYLFDVGSAVDLRDKVRLLLSAGGGTMKMRENALRLARERYTLETGREGLEGIFRRLVPGEE